MNLAQEAFGDRFATAEVSGDQVKGFPVVEEFARVVGIDVAERFTGQRFFRLVEREMGPFDVSGVMSFENKGAVASRWPLPSTEIAERGRPRAVMSQARAESS